jgi:tRNA A-37 threonylcarbamoyl transferase component Bud32/tetratricopeptide (TPR) repeat protein
MLPQSSSRWRVAAPQPPPGGPPDRDPVASRYVVEEELASGGMGVVYRVRDRSTGQARALKRMKPEAVADKVQAEAFEREYQVLAGLNHPRIIQVFDYGIDAVGPYYTMELLDGQDMRKAAPLPYRQACHCLRDVATSLALLHARRLLHRDLSPRNVRMTIDGRCKLIDFGALASFGSTSVIMGTAPSIAPESLDGAPLDQRCDLYSFGALAYWMLTGRHAFPARDVDDLPAMWKGAPMAPSTFAPDVPRELDELVLSLLRTDPRARPASVVEVISRLNLVADLAGEDVHDIERLTESFLVSPRFVGRAGALGRVRERLHALAQGRGGALRIEAAAGMGRTRLLEEIGVRAQIAGATVVRVDASTHRDWSGVARALALRLLDVLPRVAREQAAQYRGSLGALGNDVESKLSAGPSSPPAARGSMPPASAEGQGSRPPPSKVTSLDGWFAAISRSKPLVLEVDNVDDADDASLGLLVALAKTSANSAILLVVTERIRRETRQASGLASLRQSDALVLDGLSSTETRELCHSLFGDAQNLGRFADWLHSRTAGSPLHCIEISRQLLSAHLVRFIDGMWALPAEHPKVDLPTGLEEALSLRLDALSESARGLAECLGLQREQPSLELCRLLLGDSDGVRVLQVLDELARNDVICAGEDGYRFSSTALRDAVLAGMTATRREQNHARLGEALAYLAGPDDDELRIEAGWQLIQGGEDLRGADLIAEATRDSATVRRMIANLHHVGRPIEAALKVYKRHRRSIYQRMPLLAALAHAGYYEHWSWAERYGDDALDACEDLSGVRTARTLRRFLGRWLGMVVGLLVALLRFRLVPARERIGSFREMLVQLFGAVTTLTGTASLSLDVERATRVTQVLELFSMLPKRMASVGIYEFCLGLREIGRERQAAAYASFETLLRRFEDPRYYPDLPADARILYVTGAHFARGSFATMRADGRAALASADALENSGLKMYAMVASQIRFLYYFNRGELAKAAPHRELVEVHAAHVGSAWQVETWEQPALIPVATKLGDVVALTRITDRLQQLSELTPSLGLYRRFAELALNQARGRYTAEPAWNVLRTRGPREFIGWAATVGQLARAFNERGDHDQARDVCEKALTQITDADREYVTLFLDLDIEMANAQAGLGAVDEALSRLDGLLRRFDDCDHPLLHGCLHETRARIAWKSGRVAEYVHGLAMVNRWFRATGTPALIARCERLAALRDARAPRASRPPASELAGQDTMTESMNKTEVVDGGADLPTVATRTGRLQKV